MDKGGVVVAAKEEISHTVKILSNEIGRCVRCGNDTPGVTHMHGWMIGYLYDKSREHDIFQRDIENDFNIRRSTVTGMLKLMEKNGMITRTSVPYDARLKKIELTPCAIQMHEQIRKNLEIIEKQLRKNLSDEEIEQFLATANKIRENIREYSENCGKEHSKGKEDV